LSKGYSVEGVRVVPELRARWMYEFLDNFAQYNPAFIGAPGVPFNVRGAEVNRSSLALGAGVEIVHSRSLAFFVDFDSRFNSDMRSYSLTGGLRYSSSGGRQALHERGISLPTPKRGNQLDRNRSRADATGVRLRRVSGLRRRSRGPKRAAFRGRSRGSPRAAARSATTQPG